ncbi:oligoribonuclease [Yersinia enterocolitica]|nr:oligoribonuclease [Yersinia enterocolitica]
MVGLHTALLAFGQFILAHCASLESAFILFILEASEWLAATPLTLGMSLVATKKAMIHIILSINPLFGSLTR